MQNMMRKLQSGPWREILLAFLSAILGIFAEPIVQAIAPPLFKTENLPYVAFCLVSILFLANVIYSLSLWRSTSQQVSKISDMNDEIISSIGNRIQTVSFARGYEELQERIRHARHEIIILTQYTFDWQQNKAIWDAQRLNSLRRKAFYDTIQAKLRNERGKGSFRFVKIVRVPSPYKLESLLVTDPVYAQNCQYILELARTEPEFAQLRVSALSFSNNVVLIDGTFAHISFELENLDTNEFEAPFVMLVDNPDRQAIQNLDRLIRRIEAHSILVTELDSDALIENKEQDPAQAQKVSSQVQ